MDLFSWFFIFIFIQFWFFDSIQGQNISYSSCTSKFQCGVLGSLSFPFYKSTQQANCGLCKVDCEVSPNPIIELESVKYQALFKSDVFIRLKDPILEKLLKNQSCQSFERNLSRPISPSIAYRLSPFLTLFKCNNTQENTESQVFAPTNYHSYNECESFTLYYNRSVDYYPGLHIPSSCTFIQLPINTNSNGSGLFDLLTAEVVLGWTVSDECNRCYYNGGHCPIGNATEKFQCYNQKGKRNVTVLVVAGAFIGSLLGLCIIALVLWLCKRKRHGPPQFHSRNSSSVSMIHRGLEEHSQYLGIPVFSYRELEEATNKFHSSRQLGDGGYGAVYHGKLRDGKEVAIKRLYEHNHKQMQQFINEIEILTCLDHPNLVKLYGCTSRSSSELFLVYEYVPNGTIADHLRGYRAKDKLLTWPIRLKIAIETASALVYLHTSGIIHRDVKTNNILLDDDFCVKVADFGLSKLLPNDVTHISTAPQGTPGYVDPQYQECYQLTDKSDVYSFGVVLVELISSKPAVDMTRHVYEINLANFAINRIQNGMIDEVIDPSLGFETDAEIRRMTMSVAELAFQCLQVVKDMRPSMEEVLKTLKAIKQGEWKNHRIKTINGGTNNNNTSNSIEPKSVKISHPSETEDAVLLKKNIPDSPDTVIDKWASSSSSTSTGGRYT